MIYQTIRAKWGNNFISIQGNLANQSLSNFVAERAAQRDLPNNTCKMGEQLHFHSRKPGESVSKQLRCRKGQRNVTYQTIRAKWGNNFISIQGNLANQSLSNFVSERAAQRDLPNNTCKMGEQLHFHSRKPGESVSKQLRFGKGSAT